jgi:anti-anti-sigma factor
MFEIFMDGQGTVHLSGRFDASQTDHASTVLAGLSGNVTADCSALEYISSAGLSVLIVTHKRLLGSGHGLRLVHLQPRVRNVFAYAGLDKFLLIE